MSAINKLQEEILHSFFRVEDSQKFYLTGGTALAHFYLHHRRSKDLDFFTVEEGAVLPFSQTLGEFFKQQGFSVENRRTMHSFCEMFLVHQDQTTILHLAQDAAFRFGPPKEFKEYPGLLVDNLTDIASNKLLALFGRAALRDFIDVYFLLSRGNFTPTPVPMSVGTGSECRPPKERRSDEKQEAPDFSRGGVTKSQLIKLAQQKDPGFDLYWLGVALAQIHEFKSASLGDMVMLLNPVGFDDIAAFFSEWRDDIIKQLP